MIEASKNGTRRQEFITATRSGTLEMINRLIPVFPGSVPERRKTLVISPDKDLLVELRKRIVESNRDLRVGVEAARSLACPRRDDVVLIGVWKLRERDHWPSFKAEEFKTIIIDECDSERSEEYANALKHFKAMQEDSEINVISATTKLNTPYENILGFGIESAVYEQTLRARIEKDELCDYKVSEVLVDNFELGDVTRTDGDYDILSLRSALDRSQIDRKVVSTYMEMKDESAFKSTLVFCVNEAHCRELCGLFQIHGINAQYIPADVQEDTRPTILEDFKSGKIPILCGADVILEASDHSNIDSIFLARPTLSKTLKDDMITAGLAHHPGKAMCHVVDLVGLMQKDLGLEVNTPEARPPAPTFEKRAKHQVQFAKDYLKDIYERREYVTKKILDYHEQGLMTNTAASGLLDFDEFVMDIEVVKFIMSTGPFPFILFLNTKGRGHGPKKPHGDWGLYVGDGEFFLVRLRLSQEQVPIFRLFNCELEPKEVGGYREISTLLTTSNIFELLDFIKVMYPVQCQAIKEYNAADGRTATEDQIEYIADKAMVYLAEDSVYEFDKVLFRDAVRDIIAKKPYREAVQFEFTFRYSDTCYFTDKKKSWLLGEARRAYIDHKRKDTAPQGETCT
ncbi:putative ATP-dependent helicase IRC3 [Candida viswanathii]|uniref:Putative ATP-dependent helicase IRC3 n=1 Tax=Candida viswanathii TaxID=5486 RepID=A0A367XRI4_9ASCO|nr:putative ATP-dependent helicase IRC3 [Candida viswanathii]